MHELRLFRSIVRRTVVITVICNRSVVASISLKVTEI